MSSSPTWETYLTDNRQRHLDELFELLRIPSVSALPDHASDTRHAAEWVAAKLTSIGVPRVEILETAGNPVVYAEWLIDASKPTALIYGHYDVQPPDPLELWETPPFEPAIRNDRIYARGSAETRAIYSCLRALEALVATSGAPPINLKFNFEGEEEIGSPNLPPFVREHADLLACDFVLCADGGMSGPDTPSLTLGTKGVTGCQVNVRTASTDLHSGMFGASVQNAVRAASQLAASLHDADNRVAVSGFYDDVVPLSDEERADFARVPFDPEGHLGDIGATAFVGESGYTPVELNWARPTLDLNGIWGGFSGLGQRRSPLLKRTSRSPAAGSGPGSRQDSRSDRIPPDSACTARRDRHYGPRFYRWFESVPCFTGASRDSGSRETLGDLYDCDPFRAARRDAANRSHLSGSTRRRHDLLFLGHAG